MRQLQFVRATDDGHLVLESADPVEEFTLLVDPQVRSATRLEPPRPAPRHSEPDLGPREIQMRVRAGESPQELADAIGTSVERILRFAAPVVAERLRIADEARRARALRTTVEAPPVIFGEAVDDRFAAHGIAPFDVTWDSHRREDGEWVVVAEWLGGEGRHSAEWIFHRGTRTVTPVDETATDLLSDRPIRPVMPPEPVRPNLVAAPPLMHGVVSFPPMPDAHTGPIPVVDEVFDQEAPAEGPRLFPRAVSTTPAVPAPPAAPVFEELSLPLGIQVPASVLTARARRHEESDDERAARSRIPAWDEILLGVRRKQD